jgi:hypothetical protein
MTTITATQPTLTARQRKLLAQLSEGHTLKLGTRMIRTPGGWRVINDWQVYNPAGDMVHNEREATVRGLIDNGLIIGPFEQGKHL